MSTSWRDPRPRELLELARPPRHPAATLAAWIELGLALFVIGATLGYLVARG